MSQYLNAGTVFTVNPPRSKLRCIKKNMNNLHQLVREALDGRREEHSGCFVHSVAAFELLQHGVYAVSAIESEVSSLATKVFDEFQPRGLDSVSVIYARLIPDLQL